MKKFLVFCSITLCVVVSITSTVIALASSENEAHVSNQTTALIVNETPVSSEIEIVSESSVLNVTITFSKAMNAIELNQFIEKYQLTVDQLQARGYDENSNRITFFSKTTKGIEETYQLLEREAQRANIQFVGTIALYAYVDSSFLATMQEDDCTYYVDTTTNINESSTSSQTNSEENLNQAEPQFAHSVAWMAEDAGAVSYN